MSPIVRMMPEPGADASACAYTSCGYPPSTPDDENHSMRIGRAARALTVLLVVGTLTTGCASWPLFWRCRWTGRRPAPAGMRRRHSPCCR